MAQPTGSWETYDTVGIREDLEGTLSLIDPTETPFYTMCKKSKATQTLHEWLTQALAAASTSNAAKEGDAAVATARTAAVRLGNYTQILQKTAAVTGTNQAVDSVEDVAGMAKQVVLAGMELKRDIEATLLANQAKNAGAGDAATARKFASVLSWIKTNTDKGASGSDPSAADGTGTRTDGTQRAFAESQLKTVLQGAWNSGGNPDTVMVGGFNKQAFSGFTGNATKTVEVTDKKLVASVKIYESDFGTLKVVPNRFQRTRDALVLDSDMWEIASLRGIKTYPLAKVGDADMQQILGEMTLVARNEKANGIVADLTTS